MYHKNPTGWLYSIIPVCHPEAFSLGGSLNTEPLMQCILELHKADIGDLHPGGGPMGFILGTSTTPPSFRAASHVIQRAVGEECECFKQL